MNYVLICLSPTVKIIKNQEEKEKSIKNKTPDKTSFAVLLFLVDVIVVIISAVDFALREEFTVVGLFNVAAALEREALKV